ncbi:hypothetical protein Dimus_033302 [Dionaea muscipula]
MVAGVQEAAMGGSAGSLRVCGERLMASGLGARGYSTKAGRGRRGAGLLRRVREMARRANGFTAGGDRAGATTTSGGTTDVDKGVDFANYFCTFRLSNTRRQCFLIDFSWTPSPKPLLPASPASEANAIRVELLKRPMELQLERTCLFALLSGQGKD